MKFKDFPSRCFKILQDSSRFSQDSPRNPDWEGKDYIPAIL